MLRGNLLESIKARAHELRKHIVLPDATDERTIRAARIITDEGIAAITLVGNEAEIRQKAEKLGVDDYLVKSQVVIADVVERIKHHLNIT